MLEAHIFQEKKKYSSGDALQEQHTQRKKLHYLRVCFFNYI